MSFKKNKYVVAKKAIDEELENKSSITEYIFDNKFR